MALALTHKTDGTATTSPGTTASVAFANAKLYICSVSAAANLSNTVDIQTPTGGGLTWVQIAKTTTSRRQVAIYCGYVASGASTGTVSIAVTSGALARIRWSIEEVTGSAATAANNGSDAFGTPGYEQETSGQTSTSVTIGSFADATNNVAFGIVGVAANVTPTVDASNGGYTALSNLGTAGISLLVEYVLGQDTTVTSSGFASNPVVAAAVELKVAATVITGTGAITAPATTLSATGVERIIGTSAFADLHSTLTSTGVERIIGTSAFVDIATVLGALGTQRALGAISQVLPALTQELHARHGADIAGGIDQVLPAFTQAMSGVTVPQDLDMNEVLAAGFRFRPPRLLLFQHGEIHQTLPSLTQRMYAEANDDEQVLLLL